jgi:hypothetical protein
MSDLVPDIKKRTEPEGVENMVLRKIFGPKREKVAGELRKLYEQLHALVFVAKYYQSDQIKQHHIPEDSNPLHNDGVCIS